MRLLLSIPLIFFISLPGWADTWNFGEKIAIGENLEANVFQHLDATGRKNLASSGDTLAVVWEDNRQGAPQVYVAFKNLNAKKFSKDRKVSTGNNAYAPTVLALNDDRFLIAWEQDDAIWARTVTTSELGPAVPLSKGKSAQVTLASANGREIVAAWSQQAGLFSQIVTSSMNITAKGEVVRVKKPQAVEAKKTVNDQLYPVMVATPNGHTLAWEDRREGHTVILYSHAEPNKPFNSPRALNEIVQKSEKYGRGNGVTRVALTVFARDKIGAAWMDKRGFQTGYDIYAAFSDDGGLHFGANELVQDAFADQYSQWHPVITGNNSNQVLVAWDDDRDGTSGIWLAWKTKEGWSPNISLGNISDANKQQTNPAMTLDARDNLHLIWLEQSEENAPTRMMYAMGRYKK